MNITDSAALVTGGASGLGAATAERLAQGGARVVIADLRSSDGKAVAERIGATFVPTDVTDEQQVQAAIDAASEQGPLRIDVNCAGIGNAIRTVGRSGPFPLAEFTKVIQVNLVGTFNTIRLASARMAEVDPVGEERGVIVNTASIAAYDGQIGQAAYSASKGGVVGMTLPIARDLASMRIRVVTIAPGLFETPLLGTLPHEARDALGSQIPHPARLGHPSEYADLAVHVVQNPMLNGEVIRLDGAVRMPPK